MISQNIIEDRLNLRGMKLLEEYRGMVHKHQIECFCGIIFNKTIKHVLNGETDCGNHQFNEKLIGQKFNKLTILAKDRGRRANGIAAGRYLCECECGRKLPVILSNLRTGHTTSCGNCGNFRNGKCTSQPVLKIEEELNSLNIKTKHNYKIDNYYVDLFLPDLNIVIEYDEWFYHQSRIERDELRYKHFKSKRQKYLRIKTCRVKPTIGEIVEKLINLKVGTTEFEEITLGKWGDSSIRSFQHQN